MVIGIRRHRRFRKVELIFERFAQRHGLKSVFSSLEDYAIFGRKSGYTFKIQPWPGNDAVFPAGATAHPYTLCGVNMQNPQLKAFRISKFDPHYPEISQNPWETLPIHMKHSLGQGVNMDTNDMLLAGIIMTEDVTIDLGRLFETLPAGVFYISGDTMSYVLPFRLEDMKEDGAWDLIVQVLLDIKNELKLP